MEWPCEPTLHWLSVKLVHSTFLLALDYHKPLMPYSLGYQIGFWGHHGNIITVSGSLDGPNTSFFKLSPKLLWLRVYDCYWVYDCPFHVHYFLKTNCFPFATLQHHFNSYFIYFMFHCNVIFFISLLQALFSFQYKHIIPKNVGIMNMYWIK